MRWIPYKPLSIARTSMARCPLPLALSEIPCSAKPRTTPFRISQSTPASMKMPWSADAEPMMAKPFRSSVTCDVPDTLWIPLTAAVGLRLLVNR